MDESFIKRIQALDDEIAAVEVILKGMESVKAEKGLENENLYNLLQAKVAGWRQKRNELLQFLIQPLKKKKG